MAKFANEQKSLERARWTYAVVDHVADDDKGHAYYNVLSPRYAKSGYEARRSRAGNAYLATTWASDGYSAHVVTIPRAVSTEWPRASCTCDWGKSGGRGCWHVMKVRLHLEKREKAARDARERNVREADPEVALA